MSFDEIFDLTAGVYFYFYNTSLTHKSIIKYWYKRQQSAANTDGSSAPLHCLNCTPTSLVTMLVLSRVHILMAVDEIIIKGKNNKGK